jgi:hypothetical protein
MNTSIFAQIKTLGVAAMFIILGAVSFLQAKKLYEAEELDMNHILFSAQELSAIGLGCMMIGATIAGFVIGRINTARK